jgi:MoaA/NifB/PqqE/SkfB family radical SAM enzyme
MANRSTRIIRKDELFGDLSYHKIFKSESYYPLNHKLCWHPFSYAEIRYGGNVNICCPQWNPASIGNVFDDDFETIWNGEKAQAIRTSILDGSYKYCDNNTCPLIQNAEKSLLKKTDSTTNELINSVKATPKHVHFVIDNSCNLSCPSCRVSKITQLSKDRQESAFILIKKVLNSMFPYPHDEEKILSMDGSGELFSSEVYRRVFETEPVFTETQNWPNLKFMLTTNGTMMTEKIQRKYKKIFDQTAKIEISIDAGNQESYEKVRVGGHWDLLWKNLDYLYSTIKDQKKTSWQWNIIVQKNNFKSIPDFIALAEKYDQHKPVIYFSKILNWGTMTDAEFLDHAVYLTDNPLYQKYCDIMDLPEVKKYTKIRFH